MLESNREVNLSPELVSPLNVAIGRYVEKLRSEMKMRTTNPQRKKGILIEIEIFKAWIETSSLTLGEIRRIHISCNSAGKYDLEVVGRKMNLLSTRHQLQTFGLKIEIPYRDLSEGALHTISLLGEEEDQRSQK